MRALAKINLDDAVVRAPFAGTIAKRHVQPGEKVSLDSTIVTLVDLRQMVLEAAVPAADIPAVGIGQPARFKVGGFGAREFVGEVQRINPITADGSRAITIYIAVPNPDSALKGGMFAQGALTLDKIASLCWPCRNARCTRRRALPYVYMLRDEKDRAHHGEGRSHGARQQLRRSARGARRGRSRHRHGDHRQHRSASASSCATIPSRLPPPH